MAQTPEQQTPSIQYVHVGDSVYPIPEALMHLDEQRRILSEQNTILREALEWITAYASDKRVEPDVVATNALARAQAVK